MPGRIDLHAHSIFSDGELLPGEALRRAVALGYESLALTDHCDASNIDFIIPAMVRFAREQAHRYPITFLVGVELTHVPPAMVAPLAAEARGLGAQIVVVHGETLVEPVEPGTNLAAASCPNVDILAHPGLIDDETVRAAAANGVHLEISGRKGHAFGNGRVAQRALRLGARLVVDSDTHGPSDMFGLAHAAAVAAGAGLDEAQVQAAIVTNPAALVRRCLDRYPITVS